MSASKIKKPKAASDQKEKKIKILKTSVFNDATTF